MKSARLLPKSLFHRLAIALMAVPLLGISMCSKKNEGESLKRAQAACIHAIRGGLPEKARILGAIETSIQSLSTQENYANLASEWQKVKSMPFITTEADRKLEAILANSNLSTDDSNQQIISAVESTSFWKDVCSVRVKNEVKKCADKFEFDSADWKTCMGSSEIANADWLGDWSPFWGAYQKQIRPKLKEAAVGLDGL